MWVRKANGKWHKALYSLGFKEYNSVLCQPNDDCGRYEEYTQHRPDSNLCKKCEKKEK